MEKCVGIVTVVCIFSGSPSLWAICGGLFWIPENPPQTQAISPIHRSTEPTQGIPLRNLG
jgi:hypothetical protein